VTDYRIATQPAVQETSAIIARSLTSAWQAKIPLKKKNVVCKDCRVCNLCIVKGLKSEGLEKLGNIITTPQPLRKNKYLHRQSDSFSSLYFIRSGSVKSYVTNADGDELAVSFLMPGEIIGLEGLYLKQNASSIIALEDTYLCEVPYKALENLFESQPTLQNRFNELQSRRIVQELEMVMLRGQKTALHRLVAFLFNLSRRFELLRLSPIAFRLPMTRKDIAACLGLTIETVSRLFTILQDQELIKAEGRYITLTGLNREEYLYCKA
jgi:CRP/FNR family transcriptional regulator